MVKKSKIVILVIVLIISTSSMSMTPVTHCLTSLIPFTCEDQKNGFYSLEGSFDFGGNSFSLTLRRAIERDVCYSTLNLFIDVMKNNKFCINGEISNSNSQDITLNSLISDKLEWKYFL